MTELKFSLEDHRDRSMVRRILAVIDPAEEPAHNNAVTGSSLEISSTQIGRDDSKGFGFPQQGNHTSYSGYQNIRYETRSQFGSETTFNAELVKRTKEVERLNDAIQEKDTEINELQKAAEQSRNDIETKNQEIDKLKASNTELEAKVKELQNRLNEYEPAGISEHEKGYYNIKEAGILTPTLDSNAPYIVAINSEGNISFKFNSESGPCKDACSKKNEMINPFCEIIEECTDANSIGTVKWGDAKGVMGEDIEVIVKSKVKLNRI